jgi:hypothetical protein
MAGTSLDKPGHDGLVQFQRDMLQRTRMATAEARHCGTCTACCDGWLKIKVRGHDVHPGKPCPFSSGHHCTIYETRPRDPCGAFMCGWLAGNSPLPDWMRPDKAKVILLPANFNWRGRRVDVAVPVDDGPTTEALEWLKAFSTTNGRPLLYRILEDWYAFGPPDFQTEMRDRIGRGEQIWT